MPEGYDESKVRLEELVLNVEVLKTSVLGPMVGNGGSESICFSKRLGIGRRL